MTNIGDGDVTLPVHGQLGWDTVLNQDLTNLEQNKVEATQEQSDIANALAKADPLTSVQTVSSATATATAFAFVECNAASNAITLSLPASPTAGTRVTVRKTDNSANVVTLSATVDGMINPTLTLQYETVDLISDGTNWMRMVRPRLANLVDYPATSDARYIQTGATAGGDLSGTLPSPTVGKIQGVPITTVEANLVSDLNNSTTRSATATLLPGEETIFTGSTSGQTLTLPASPPNSSVNSITNTATVAVTIAPGAGATISNFGTTGNLTIPSQYAFALVYIGSTWYVQQAGPADFAKSSVLSIANGGTGSATQNFVDLSTAQSIGGNKTFASGIVGLVDPVSAPSTNPSGGVTVYSASPTAIPFRVRDTSGNVRGLLPGAAVATANQSITSTTTQTASTYLTIPVEANATYLMSMYLFVTGANGNTIVYAFTAPASATMTWGSGGSDQNAATSPTTTTTWNTTGGNTWTFAAGSLITGATAGSLTLTFAQGTSNATATTVLAGSVLFLDRVK